jgi:hypothetical protein
MTQKLKHCLQKKYLESNILYLLLIKQFHHLQGGLNNIRASRKFFGFLFTSEALQLLDNKSLKSSCDDLEAALKIDGKSDIDDNELYMELKFIQDFMPKENMGPIEILKFLK